MQESWLQDTCAQELATLSSLISIASICVSRLSGLTICLAASLSWSARCKSGLHYNRLLPKYSFGGFLELEERAEEAFALAHLAIMITILSACRVMGRRLGLEEGFYTSWGLQRRPGFHVYASGASSSGMYIHAVRRSQ